MLSQKVEEQKLIIKSNNVEIEILKGYFKCTQCEFIAKNLEEMVVHMSSESHAVKDENLHCNACDFNTKEQSKLTIHTSVNHTTKFKEFKFQ